MIPEACLMRSIIIDAKNEKALHYYSIIWHSLTYEIGYFFNLQSYKKSTKINLCAIID